MKTTEKLTAFKIKNLKTAGRYSDGQNLYVMVKPNGRRYYVLLFRHLGRTIECGLGSCDVTSLKEARIKASEGRALLREGKNPKDYWAQQRQVSSSTPTFGKVARDFLDSKSTRWRSARYRDQAQTSLLQRCKLIEYKSTDKITTEDILAVVQPVAERAPPTAQRFVRLIGAVLDRAQRHGHIPHDRRNPAAGLHQDLPHPKEVRHHASLAYAEMPAFMSKLCSHRRDADGHLRIDVYALEFCVLCASRSGEVRHAVWSEIDMRQRTWTVPGERMKNGKAHIVPLSTAAMRLLEEMEQVRSNSLVFPGYVEGRPLSDKAFERLLRKLGCEATAHGFRASFKSWSRCETSFPREIAEQALAHTIGNKTEQAYDHVHPVDRIRPLLAAWADYLDGQSASNVVPMVA